MFRQGYLTTTICYIVQLKLVDFPHPQTSAKFLSGFSYNTSRDTP